VGLEPTTGGSQYLDNHATHCIEGGPEQVVIRADLKKDLARMAAHADKQYSGPSEGSPSARLPVVIEHWRENSYLTTEQAAAMRTWLDSIAALVDESNDAEEARHNRLIDLAGRPSAQEAALKILNDRLPLFVLFNRQSLAR